MDRACRRFKPAQSKISWSSYGEACEISTLIGSIVDLTGVRPLRDEEVRSAADVFTIDAHIVTHPFLTIVGDVTRSRKAGAYAATCRAKRWTASPTHSGMSTRGLRPRSRRT